MSWSAGDWMCAACQHQNFKKRDICHSCSYPKYGGPDPSMYSPPTDPLPGDWYCTAMNCNGAHNFASRTHCYKCGALKVYYPGGRRPGEKNGDWTCTSNGCGAHNYAKRNECYQCKTPRNFGGAV